MWDRPAETTSLLGSSASGSAGSAGTFAQLAAGGGKGASSGASIDARTLHEALGARVRRFRQCRSLPLSLIAYGFFIASLLLHAKVPTAYDFEVRKTGIH